MRVEAMALMSLEKSMMRKKGVDGAGVKEAKRGRPELPPGKRGKDGPAPTWGLRVDGLTNAYGQAAHSWANSQEAQCRPGDGMNFSRCKAPT